MTTIVEKFLVTPDLRKRFTIRGAAYEHYLVSLFSDGHIELYPRVLADPTIAAQTLKRMDEVMEQFARGHVGKAMDAAEMLKLVEADE